MDYEFNAPSYQDFQSTEIEAPKSLALEPVNDDNIPVPLKEESPKKEIEQTVSPAKMEVDVLEEVIPQETTEPEEEKEEEEESSPPKKTPSHKTPQNIISRNNQPVRQSPRLAVIAKSIRRSNAARGVLPGSGNAKSHRRSLSEGSKIVNHFTKVDKKRTGQNRKMSTLRPTQGETAEGSKLKKEDIRNLENTTRYNKILAQNRQRSSNLHDAKGSLKQGPLKPTKPVEFSFATDTRLRSKPDHSEESAVEFTRSLRSNMANDNNDGPKGTTKVQPFNLHSSKPKEVGQPFLSMAELNLKFYTKTPQRFRTKRYNSNDLVQDASKKPRDNTGGVTQPQTPKLSSRLRARSVDHPTREQQEEKEIEEAQKHRFKARPANKKILAEPQIKPVETSKKITVAQPFNITDTKKAIENNPTGEALLNSCKQFMGSYSSLASIPHGGISSTWEKKSTEVKPFSFDSRDMETIRKKKEKIKKMIEEEKKAAEFHAQPMPVFEDGVTGLPSKMAPTPTKVQPFNLISDVRGSSKQHALQRELEALEEMEKKQRKFEAQPDSVLHKQPFVPQKSKKPLTDISGFSLNSDKRAEEREAFDVHLKEKEDELMAYKMENEERKKREEDLTVQKMRKNAVHKAQPVRHYKPVEIKQGLLPSTLPLTPHFNIDHRLRARAESKMSVNADHTIDLASTTNVDGTFTME